MSAYWGRQRGSGVGSSYALGGGRRWSSFADKEELIHVVFCGVVLCGNVQ
jgi:hypothetical protein